jgi:hypothetical protein
MDSGERFVMVDPLDDRFSGSPLFLPVAGLPAGDDRTRHHYVPSAVATHQAVGAFIGAWTAAKIAANWGRMKSEDKYVRSGQLVALIGNALSFAWAIIAALAIQKIV